MKSFKNSDLYQKFVSHIEEKNWFSAGDGTCAVAVSGGGDSMALLMMLCEYLGAENVVALHFDHGLRDESEEEGQWLKGMVHTHGIGCEVQRWDHASLAGNKQQAARQARYNFFAEKCAELKLSSVAVAHNRDDIVETMLMRLGRGSGLKGLAAMEDEASIEGAPVVRPLMFASRQEIRDFLNEYDIPYLNDPSNEDDQFYRVRVRRLQATLDGSGISFEHMAASAKSLRRAEKTVQFYANQAYENCVTLDGTSAVLSLSVLDMPEEVQLRVLERVILDVNPQPMAPRTSKRISVFAKMKSGDRKFSLGGVVFEKAVDEYRLTKE